MSNYLTEALPRHDQAPTIGVLLMNLGTPTEPTAKALRPYLKQFLSDPRVVEIPRAIWWLILHGIILTTRPKASAQKYAKIWLKDGSPLRVYTERQTKLLQGYFTQAGHNQVVVEYAMRYGQPDAASAIQKLKARGATRILALPLYPQYAASTSASAVDAIGDAFKALRNQPALRIVRNFHDHPDYIRALTRHILQYWQTNGRGERLVFSFHGTPKFSLDKGDPYFCECHKTARLVAESLNLKSEQYFVSFQSRFGKAEWLQPYTQPSLEKFAKNGAKNLDIICPGFVSDCLETLEEIALECRAAFIAAGGTALNYIPCLNDKSEFIFTLQQICKENMQDWLVQPVPDAQALAQRKQRAQQLGAKS